jgi:hypothetical protein
LAQERKKKKKKPFGKLKNLDKILEEEIFSSLYEVEVFMGQKRVKCYKEYVEEYSKNMGNKLGT